MESIYKNDIVKHVFIFSFSKKKIIYKEKKSVEQSKNKRVLKTLS